MGSSTPILIASANRSKLREFQAILSGTRFEFILPVDIGLSLEVVEDGSTYAENAALKGIAFAQASQLLTLSDDSGLEVDVLDGLPGLRSARFAPQPNATDADRRAYLIQWLGGKHRPWRALFRCLVALAVPGGEAASRRKHPRLPAVQLDRARCVGIYQSGACSCRPPILFKRTPRCGSQWRFNYG